MEWLIGGGVGLVRGTYSDVIPPADPATQRLMQAASPDPFPPP